MFFALIILNANSQVSDTTRLQNTASRLLADKRNKLVIGGYGQIDYNQPLDNNIRNNGILDVHRLVILFGYKFNSKTQFISEIEYEHVSEVYIEQAFINYRINDYVNFRGGLLLIPMGIINEYHEPPLFNGVERPGVDNIIVPTTWREIGAGFTGNISDISLKYQLYLINGFNGYDDDTGILNGANGLRNGRQKGAESFLSSPNFSGKIDFYGISRIKLGIAGYFGNSQSDLFNGIDRNDDNAIQKADSSFIGIKMTGFNAIYNYNGIKLKGQFIYTVLNNTNEYNSFTGKDIGSSMLGFYAELGYNIFPLLNITDKELIPFVRYENYNTHYTVSGSLEKNDVYDHTDITLGIGLWLAKGAVLKADYQLLKTKADNDFSNSLNLGIGIMF